MAFDDDVNYGTENIHNSADRQKKIAAIHSGLMKPLVSANQLTNQIRKIVPEYHFDPGTPEQQKEREKRRDNAQIALENLGVIKTGGIAKIGRSMYPNNRGTGDNLALYIHHFMSRPKDPETGELLPNSPQTVLTSQKKEVDQQLEETLQELDREDRREKPAPEKAESGAGLPEITDYEEELRRVAALPRGSEAYQEGEKRLVGAVFDHIEKNLDTYVEQIDKMSDDDRIKNAVPVAALLGLADVEQGVGKFKCLGDERLTQLKEKLGPVMSMNGPFLNRLRVLADPLSPNMNVDQVSNFSVGQLNKLTDIDFLKLYQEPADLPSDVPITRPSAFNDLAISQGDYFNRACSQLAERAKVETKGHIPKVMAMSLDGRLLDEEAAKEELGAAHRPVYMMLKDHPEKRPELVFINNGKVSFDEAAKDAFLDVPGIQLPKEPKVPGMFSYLWDNICKAFGSRGSTVQQYEADLEAYEKLQTSKAREQEILGNLNTNPFSPWYFNSPNTRAKMQKSMIAETQKLEEEKAAKQQEKSAETKKNTKSPEQLEREKQQAELSNWKESVRKDIRSLPDKKVTDAAIGLFTAIFDAKADVRKGTDPDGETLTTPERLGVALAIHEVENKFLTAVKESAAQKAPTEALQQLLTHKTAADFEENFIAKGRSYAPAAEKLLKDEAAAPDFEALCPGKTTVEAAKKLNEYMQKAAPASVEKTGEQLSFTAALQSEKSTVKEGEKDEIVLG